MSDPAAILSMVSKVTAGPAAAAIAPPQRAPLIVPVSKVSISVRAGTEKDIPFIDQLQKMHSHMVGWFPTKQIEGKIRLGHVLVAEQRSEVRDQKSDGANLTSDLRPLTSAPVGYVIAHDQYMGRDDIGIIYQLNVLPLKQRHLIGASLIKAVFEKAAYGCRLFGCWCAQDIQANYFWESIGFVPLAFKTGSRGKQRIHIFWQRRIRQGDETTPYWFPSQTKSGLIREDRLVLPIPPGTHWRDAKPVVLPQSMDDAPKPKALPPTRPPESKEAVSVSRKMAIVRSQSKHLKGTPPGKAAIVTAGGIRYIERGDYEAPAAEQAKPKRKPSAPRAKNDPKLIAATRELRDRWLEEVNSGKYLPELGGKYDISRALPDPPKAMTVQIVSAVPVLPSPIAA